jgi:hypothetical protein
MLRSWRARGCVIHNPLMFADFRKDYTKLSFFKQK